MTAGSRGLHTTFGLIGRGAALAAGAAGLGGLIAGFKGVYGEAREAQKVGAQTNAVIRSTGGAAKVSAVQVSALATAISNKVGVDDEAIQSGANLLLTFTKVRNEAGRGNNIFDQATAAVTDMTAAMNGGKVTQEGLRATSIRVGRALNDPIKGMTALTRSGVAFTKGQKDQVAALVASGDTLGAQRIILAELNKEFGGSAAAGTNAMQKLGVVFGNIKEQVGTALLPVIDRFATWLAAVLPGAVNAAGRAFGVIGRAIGIVVSAFKDPDLTSTGFAGVLERIGVAGRRVYDFVVGTLVPGVKALFAAFREGDVTSDGFVGVMERIGSVARVVSDFFAAQVIPRLRQFAGFMSANVLPAVRTVAGFIAANFVPALRAVAGFLSGRVFPILRQVGGFLASTFGPTFQALGQTVQRNVVPPLLQLWAAIQRNMPAFIAVAKVVGTVIAVVAALAAKILGFLLPILIRLAGFLLGRLFGLIARTVQYFGNLVRAVQSAWGTFRAFLAIVSEVWRRFIAATSTAIGRAVGLITGIRAKVLDAITGAKTWLVNIGKDVIGGLWSGFRAAMGRVGEVLGSVKDAIVGGLKRLFHIGSPSKVMAELGGHMITGLIKGLLTQSGALASTVKSIGGNIAGIFGGIDLGFGRGSTSAGAMQSMVAGYAQMLYGWTGAQWTALNKLLTRESGFNPNAQNPTSTAYGLFQFLDSTWASVNARKTSNPQAQTLAGLRYIKQRYGDPGAAWAHEMMAGWYGSGLPPTVFDRPTLIGVGESGAETVSVIPHRRAGGATVAPTTVINVNLTTVGALDPAATNKIRQAIREALRTEGRPAVV